MQRYAPYPEYLPNGVPVGWEKKRLRFALRLNPSKGEIRLRESDKVSFVPMEAVGEYGGIRLGEEKELSEVGSGYTYFCDDDVVVAKITPCFENGKGALAKGLKNKTAFGTTELHVLRADQTQLDPRFLFYLTICGLFRKFGESEMYGAGGQKRVPESFIKDFRAGLPSVSEQQTIARFLDYKTAQIDALIVRKQALLEKLAEKRSALISHAVTKGLDPSKPMKDSGVSWLGKIPAHWKQVPFKWCCHITEGQVDPKKGEYSNLPLIAPNHIESGTGHLIQVETAEDQGAISGKYFYKRGAVLYSKIRPALVKACIAESDGLCSADMYPIYPGSGLLSEFLLYQILSKGFTQFALLVSERVAMPKINREALGAFKIAIPPEHEQENIVKFIRETVEKLDSQLKRAVEAIQLLQEYRSALITNAVTGKIDVRDFKLPEVAK